MRPSSKTVAVLLLLLSAPVLARTSDADRINKTPALSLTLPGQDLLDPATLADQIDSMIAMRTAMMDRTAPQPDVGCLDPQQVTRRLDALAELDSFTRSTVAGLIEAAPSSELKAETAEELSPVMTHHRAEMSTALIGLMNVSVVREKPALAADVARLAQQAARP